MSEKKIESQFLMGVYGGLLATVPMTIWMILANRFFPTPVPDPLPPEEITVNLAKKAKVESNLKPHQKKKKISLINHFLYGGIIASPFGLVPANLKREHAISSGISYGLLVWGSNYLGLLPKLELYPSAKNEPVRMNGIMIVAHIIWGGALGLISSRMVRKGAL